MNKEHFKYLFDIYFDAIRNYLYFRSGDSELATDIAQECFMKVWEKRASFKDPPCKALLYKMANDLFISRYRKNVVAQNYIANEKQYDETESPEDILQYKELSRKYELALTQLSEKQRVVFLMSRDEGFKYSEIAERLNLSVKAVEKRMKNALQFLRNALKNETILNQPIKFR
ncbi:RNA polymerase subunit sigma-24 [Ancylomarina euxinus]|uniref:RNA polymerase subunit sigma-24 n=1 Tax=Ancylomarina euxinus TaxID=2283627 RepID=A0A425Y153_9BACT|nr:sigma-70 family RNA polymerase sigma factor [Ancylomarina euxinus]MCZ4693805.1 sigma-70 family RNA polymerase sigma factor [Ancylomarina euxinus]MUP15116.1 sigma-70 family RNA polymerase sigma factor [Ancylomarina euxinus]RRG21538.1 RNA polymerase subunit sigma-24 [Ancylomarina euxinus]